MSLYFTSVLHAAQMHALQAFKAWIEAQRYSDKGNSNMGDDSRGALGSLYHVRLYFSL